MVDSALPIYGIFSALQSRTCILFRESLTWRDAVRAVIPRKSP